MQPKQEKAPKPFAALFWPLAGECFPPLGLLEVLYRSPGLVFLSLVLATLPACQEDKGSSSLSSFAQRDSAGIRIVESISPGWEDTAAWSVEKVPILDLATSGVGEPHEFHQVQDAARLPNGSIAVADNHASNIRFFSPTGVFLQAVGREGDGPGEFRWPASLDRYGGDALIVFDPRSQRVTVLSANGEVQRIIKLDVPGIYVRDLHPLDDTTFVARLESLPVPREKYGFFRGLDPVIRLSTAGRIIDTVAVAPGYEEFYRRGIPWAPLFGKDLHFTVHRGRILLGDASRMEVETLSPSGRLERVIRIPGFDLNLTAREIREERDPVMESSPPALQSLYSSMPEPKIHPAYSNLLVDTEGFLWVEEFQGRYTRMRGGKLSRWIVFSPNGEWLGPINLPTRFFVFEIGADYVLGKRYDELDVEHVEILRLNRVRSLNADGVHGGDPRRILPD